jgi:hypothetical protein
MSDLATTQAQAMEQAEAEGLEVIHGDSQTLLIDLDDAESIRYYNEQLPSIKKELEARGNKLTKKQSYTSKSGVGRHVILKLKHPLPLEQRLIIQACLGSDRVKEFLSLMRFVDGDPEPCLLFKP